MISLKITLFHENKCRHNLSEGILLLHTKKPRILTTTYEGEAIMAWEQAISICLWLRFARPKSPKLSWYMHKFSQESAASGLILFAQRTQCIFHFRTSKIENLPTN